MKLYYLLGILMLAEYGAAALIIFGLSRWKKTGRFDFHRKITKKQFLWRLVPIAIAAVLELLILVGLNLFAAYVMPMRFTAHLIVSRLIQFPIDVFAYVVIELSWLQRYRAYPRGFWLAVLMGVMYMGADLFLPWPVRYCVLILGFAIGLIIPEDWKALGEKQKQ